MADHRNNLLKKKSLKEDGSEQDGYSNSNNVRCQLRYGKKLNSLSHPKTTQRTYKSFHINKYILK